MTELFSLGELYISDFIKIDEKEKKEKIELKLILDDETGCVKLEQSAPKNQMYGKYWYRSGINQTMKQELKNITENISSLIELNENDLWIDIACNDGTLLSFLPSKLIRVGIDPADNSFKNESEKHADLILQDFFSYEIFSQSKFSTKRAKVITSIAMFYDLENPEKFLNDIYKVLDDDGIWVLQLSYTPLMLQQLAFDNICHEHIFYYSLFNIKNLFESCGLKIIDCQLNDVNGGSFRIYVMKDIGNVKKFSTQPYRDICNFRINSILEYEKKLKLDDKKTWDNFYNSINELKKQTINFIKQEKDKGKVIWGYGASTKGNTLLQYFEIDNTMIDGIADRNPQKWGLKTIGTNIPIFSEEEMRKNKPDYLLILPWHFIEEFKEREFEFLKNGGKFIIPCPKFEII